MTDVALASSNLAAPPIAPAEVNQQFVLTKCDYFTDVQLWPLRATLDPERWLSNFEADEIEHAVHLLNAFLLFREPLVNELFSAAFQGLSRRMRKPGEPLLSTQAAWRDFADNVLITYVTGEDPNPTDSGHLFARKARQVLAIEEERILSPEGVLQELVQSGPRPVVFVDDFVGSGSQFVTTWHRQYTVLGSVKISFAKLAALMRNSQFFYCPVLCTERGQSVIAASCPSVIVNAAHMLPRRYSVMATDSVIWPDRLLPSARAFVTKASRRAGIPDEEMQGFDRLALALAFEHSVPDATLPLFHWNDNGWKPLVHRK